MAKKGVKKTKSTQNSTKLDWTQIFRVVHIQQMINASDEIFLHPLAKIWFLAKKGVKTPKISSKLTKLDCAQIFKVARAQQMIKVGDEKFYSPFSQN